MVPGQVLLGPIAGLLADRFPRRRLMIIADLARGALVTVLVITHSHVGVAFAVAFGLSVGSLVFNPAASSLVPEVVDESDIVKANTALWTVAVSAQVVLAPLAGVIIAASGVGPAFAVGLDRQVGFEAVAILGTGLVHVSGLRVDRGNHPLTSDLAGDPPRPRLVTLLDVLAGDQREQPDEVLLLVIEIDPVKRVEDRERVVHESGDELVASGRVVPRDAGLPAAS